MKKSNLFIIFSATILSFLFITSIAFSEDALFVDQDGNVGIGTTSPGGKLEVKSNAANIIKLIHTADEDYTLINLDSAGDFILDTYGAHPTVSPGQYVWKQSGTEVMRIKSGKVGIGTNDPTGLLHVYKSTTNAELHIEAPNNNAVLDIGTQNDGKGYIRFSDTDSQNLHWFFVDHSDDSMNFRVNAATRMKINSSGNVGIGTGSPNEPLTVQSAGSAKGIGIVGRTDHYGFIQFFKNDGTTLEGSINGFTGMLSFSDSTGNVMNLKSSNVGIGIMNPVSFQLQLSTALAGKLGGGTWFASSDIRIKTNIKKLTNAADIIAEYPKPILFKWKNPEEHENITREIIGISAQDLEKANPNMVHEAEWTGKDAELAGGKVKSIYFSNEFFALQLGAVQELIERVEDLETENRVIKTELCARDNSYSFCAKDRVR